VRILVVEDQPDLLRTVAQTLREEGYAVDEAADGTEGLFKAVHVEYDAIVLDLLLPGLDGRELLGRLRACKSTPVLLLTARDAVADRVAGLDAGADDYLTKPCDLSELLARLRALIRRSAGTSRPQIEIGDVRVDTVLRTVTRSGRPVELTAWEHALVEFLALRRGEVVSRTTLYEHLMDEDDGTMSNLIDVHVYNVRRKLGSGFIVTRRGLGYSIPR